MTSGFGVDAYFERIGYLGSRSVREHSRSPYAIDGGVGVRGMLRRR